MTMSFKKPSHQLDDSCSIIHNGTLFSYTKTAFQALPLRKGAKWLELPMGVSVQGGVCVKVEPITDPASTALFIVGGVSDSSDYQGLQRYKFEDGIWETIIPSDPVTQNRLYHGSIYLNSSNTILVFSGSQDGNKIFSTQTFTIQATEPFRVLSHESMAPPAISPMLLPWSDGQAAYLGGSTSNKNVMIFDAQTSWFDSNVTLANPFYDPESIKSVIIIGDDSSKALYTFDLTVSPNEVNRTILVDESGQPVQNSQPVSAGENANSVNVTNQGLTIATWPAYNDSFAPTVIRNSYALSQDDSGLVVISGGSADDLICLFEARDNSWEDAMEILGPNNATRTTSPGSSANVDILSNIFSSPSPSTSALTKSTGTAEASRDSVNPAQSGPMPVRIIISVLGSIILAIAITILILIFCKRKNRRKRYQQENSLTKPYDLDEKDGMDFMDKDDPSMLSMKSSAPGESPSIGSPLGLGKKGVKKANRLSYQSYKSAISKPILVDDTASKGQKYFENPGPVPPRGEEKNDTTRQSSGWNQYWSDGSKPNDATGLGISGLKSNYSDELRDEKSIQIPPLNPGERADIYNVRLGSPTVAYQPQRYAMKGEIGGSRESFDSLGSRYSYNNDRNGNMGGYDQDRYNKAENQSVRASPPSGNVDWLNMSGKSR